MVDLPDAARANIVRLMNREPNSPHWSGYISLKTAIALANSEGPWKQTAQELFHDIGTMRNRDRLNSKLKCTPIAKRHVMTVAQQNAVVGTLVQLLGPSMKSISFRNGYDSLLGSPSAVIAENCHNLRHLSIWCLDDSDLTTVLAARGPNLTVLELKLNVLSEEHTMAIANHCGRLQSLMLHAQRYAISLSKV